MRAPLLALIVLLPLALAPADAASSVHERNVAFFWSIIGDHDPAGVATMHDGRTMALADAVTDAATRAGNVDLAAMANGAAVDGDEDTYVGDVWLLSIGPGGCSPTVIAPTPIPFTPVAPQAWIYGGGIGTMSGHGTHGVTVTSWTTKTSGFYSDAYWTVTGHSDFYCFSFFGLHLAAPFTTGIAEVTPS